MDIGKIFAGLGLAAIIAMLIVPLIPNLRIRVDKWEFDENGNQKKPKEKS